MQPRIASRFKGLNNVSDPLRLGFGWLQRADDVAVTDSGALKRRGGFSLLSAGVMRGAYSTLDFTRMYVVNDDALQRVEPDTSLRTLRTGLAPRDMHWAEVNKTVYYTNGVDSGIILGDDSVIDWGWPVPGAPMLSAAAGALPPGLYRAVCTYVLPDGRETGSSDVAEFELTTEQGLAVTGIPQVADLRTQVYICPANSSVFALAFETTNADETWNAGADALGYELMNMTLNPLPAEAIYPAFYAGRVYAAQYLPAQDSSVVWFSEPLGYHLFGLDKNFFIVPGRIALLAPTPKGLIVGTDARIYAYDGADLVILAEYGVTPGCGWALDDDSSILFWSKRGVCRALPFENLTHEQVSLAPGLSAGAAIMRRNGQKHFVVALRKGGDGAFNQRG